MNVDEMIALHKELEDAQKAKDEFVAAWKRDHTEKLRRLEQAVADLQEQWTRPTPGGPWEPHSDYVRYRQATGANDGAVTSAAERAGV